MSSNFRPDTNGQATRIWAILGIVIAFAAIGAYQQATRITVAETSTVDVANRFARLPMEIAGWTGTNTTLDEKQLRVSEAQAYFSRRYTKNGQTVAVLILLGEPGPLGAHTPDVCYGASGHRQLGQPYRIATPNGAGTLWTARFESPSTPPSQIEVIWGWGTNGTWAASDVPRVEFAGHSRIYKIYVSRRLTANATGEQANAFLSPLLSELRVALGEPLNPKH